MPETIDPEVLPLGEELICPLHPVYRGVRAEGPPRAPYVPDGHHVWLVTRYEDARAVLADSTVAKDVLGAAALYNRRTGAGRPLIGGRLAWHMLNLDPPDHTRLRKLVNRSLGHRVIEGLRPTIEATANGLLDALEGRERADLIADFALPLTIVIICSLLGVPDEELPRIHGWADSLARFYPPEEANEVAAGIAADVAALLEAKRARPADDMLTALIRAHEAGDLTEDELVAMVYLLIVAGFEATVNLIANGTLALLCNPGQLKLLRDDPGLLPGAVDEFMRYDGPATMAMLRHTTAPLRVGGVEIPAGEFVLVSLRAANHDGAQFPAPERLDVTRQAGGHLGFGHGIHYCLGAPLAKVEGEIAIGALLARFPRLALATEPEDLVWLDGTLVHQMVAMPVSLTG